jgi:hypothetical protein
LLFRVGFGFGIVQLFQMTAPSLAFSATALPRNVQQE